MTMRPANSKRARSRGQVLVIFAGSVILLMALSAVIVDISWYWVNTLRVQRAADAAALAGAVMLPERQSDAFQLARDEAKRNGYVDGAGSVIIPSVEPGNPRLLKVEIQAPIGTFFMRVLGINEIQVDRTAKAEYVLPVPMGSPQNYYGVGFFEDTSGVQSVPDPGLAGGTLDSQGFWGAIFTSGGVRENGDLYAPAFIGNGVPGLNKGDPSPTYDGVQGYDYTIEVGTGGQVKLFDPIFCGTGNNGSAGSYGAGDHWTDHAPNQVVAPVSITYRLYDTNGTVGDPSDDGAPVDTLAYDPAGKTLGDMSGSFGTPQNSTDANLEDCATNPAHNQWVDMASGLPAGTYRLNVNTSLDANNLDVGAENLFSIWVASASPADPAKVYGSGRMAAYTNLKAGNQTFFFSQIEDVHAGKTLEIKLFDPGESSGDAFLRFLDPDGNAYTYATFDWASDDGRSDKKVTSLQTSIGGVAQFNNHMVTIDIALPKTYGKGGLNPPGPPAGEPGWWKIEYNINAANDTTTWAVSIRGNPVHLILP